MNTTTVGERLGTLFLIVARPTFLGWLTAREFAQGYIFESLLLASLTILLILIGWHEFRLDLIHEEKIFLQKEGRHVKKLHLTEQQTS